MWRIGAAAALLATAVVMAQSNAPSPPSGAAQPGSATQTAQPAPAAAPTSPAQATQASPGANSGRASTNPADRSIETQVLAQFAHKAEFQNVNVTVVDGVVTLEGSVPTKVERRQAKALVRSVNGVKKVQERLSLSGDGVAGPGTMANTTTTAQNTAGSISESTKAEAGTAEGAGAMPQPPSTSTVTNSNVATTPSSGSPVNAGGTTGAAVGNAPQSSSVGAGPAVTQPARPVVGRATSLSGPSQTSNFGLTTVDTASLANKINTALKNDPTLANNNVMVNVSDQGVEVTGSVDSSKEKLTAMRIAQSYAGNFKVVDRITLAGHPAPSQQNAGTNPAAGNATTPPPNVSGNQVLPQAGAARNVPTGDPKTAGDKSTNPR